MKDFFLRIFEKDPNKRITVDGILNHPWVKDEKINKDFFNVDVIVYGGLTTDIGSILSKNFKEIKDIKESKESKEVKEVKEEKPKKKALHYKQNSAFLLTNKNPIRYTLTSRITAPKKKDVSNSLVDLPIKKSNDKASTKFPISKLT